MQGETRFKQTVLKDLKKLPTSWVIKTQERARKGTLDILICLHGLFVAIELKRDGEELEPLQKVNLEKIQAAGGIAFKATPSSWPGQFKLLQELKL